MNNGDGSWGWFGGFPNGDPESSSNLANGTGSGIAATQNSAIYDERRSIFAAKHDVVANFCSELYSVLAEMRISRIDS